MKNTKPFLDDNYDIPSESNYMKFEKGDNRFRVLDAPIMGYEWWIEKGDGKREPKRVKMGQPIPMLDYDDENKPKHFWAMVVWNYQAKRVQILEITQKSVMKAIKNYSNNEKWGKPYEYDLVVTREGDKLTTEYTTIAEPKEPVSPEIDKAFQEMSIDIEALFRNDDPFKVKEKVVTDDEITNAFERGE